MSKKTRRIPGTGGSSGANEGDILENMLDQARQMIMEGRTQDVIDLLDLLLERYPRSGELYYYLAFAYTEEGRPWQAVTCYRKAIALTRQQVMYYPLGHLYLDLGLRVLASQALKKAVREEAPEEVAGDALAHIEAIETSLSQLAGVSGRPVKTVEEGLRLMEEGQVALQNGDYEQCIRLNRMSIRHLGPFPPSYNNLSLAQFYAGQWKEAIQTSRRVLEFDPRNIMATSNLVRYLALTGSPDEARTYWDTIKHETPESDELRVKMAEAALAVDDDQTVRRMLKAIEDELAEDEELTTREQYWLAVAEANLGLKTARKRLKQIKDEDPQAARVLEALNAGRTGMGSSRRFSYLSPADLMPMQEFNRLIELIDKKEVEPDQKLDREIRRILMRYPQTVLLGKLILYELDNPQIAIHFLTALDTPEAYAVLREFAVGQTGSDEDRLSAINALQFAGQMQPGEKLRIWQDGKWVDVELRKVEIKPEEESGYDPRVDELVEKGQRAFQAGKFDQAEKLYLQAIELEPRAKEAFNNLGTVYSMREEHDRAKEMYRKALEIEPLYALARCNLAVYALNEEKFEEAQALIDPLNGLPRMSAQATAFVSYIRAQIAIARGDLEMAINQLKLAVQVNPEFSPAHEQLSAIEMIEQAQTGFSDYYERLHQRQKAARKKKQHEITTAPPTLAEALAIYTKDQLLGIEKALPSSGGVSALKKKQLHEHLVNRLSDPYVVSWLLNDLSEEERKAVYDVLDHGGTLNWDAFDKAYGNDLEESPYWNWHEPESTMGRLRVRGLLAEATLDGETVVTIPYELREHLNTLRQAQDK